MLSMKLMLLPVFFFVCLCVCVCMHGHVCYYLNSFFFQQDGSIFLSLSSCLQRVEAHWSDVSEELGCPHL